MAEAKKEGLDLMSYLYTKTFKCPVCLNDFIDFLIRRSKLRAVGTDSDFRTHYQDIDPNLYEVTLCTYCGYAALSSSFDRITSRQQDMIKEKITPSYKYVEFSLPLTPQDALTRYKMALNCVQAVEGKASQKAVLCLKMAWIYRDAGDEKTELTLLRYAYAGFKEAFMTENFPLGAMDESTTKYLIAELARRLRDYEEALKMVGDVIVSRSTTGSLKNRAQDLKERIREEREIYEKAKSAKAAATAAAPAPATSS